MLQIAHKLCVFFVGCKIKVFTITVLNLTRISYKDKQFQSKKVYRDIEMKFWKCYFFCQNF